MFMQVKSHHLDNTDGAELYATEETLEAIAIMPLVALLLFIAGNIRAIKVIVPLQDSPLAWAPYLGYSTLNYSLKRPR